VQDHRQAKRWAKIETTPCGFVKLATGGLLAPRHVFPLLAIAPTERHAGIVCLDERLRPIRARSLRLRDRRTDEGKRDAIVAALEEELELIAPRTVVLDSFDTAGRTAIREDVRARAEAWGASVVLLPVSDAIKRITGADSARGAALALIERYVPLRKRL
jgi:hypothetical protein